VGESVQAVVGFLKDGERVLIAEVLCVGVEGVDGDHGGLRGQYSIAMADLKGAVEASNMGTDKFVR
jgi:hypothetical protein